MVKGTVTIKNKSGLHARPASVFVKETLKYKSAINIVVNGKEYNAKSILGVLAACAKTGTEIEIICNGDDETEALAGMIAIVESGLGE
ncbi:MAG: HPr family phosphocarrier protein [Christensenellales bacterium]|jgi:phosphocarrier protein HPr